MVTASAITESTKDVNRRSGTRKMRNLAIVDSIKAIATSKHRALNTKNTMEGATSVGSSEVATHQGKKILAPKAMNITSLLQLAHSISANRFPEYSRIIAS